MLVGRLYDLAHRRVADATCRIVDDSPQRLLVVRVRHHAEVGYHVLDLLTLIEAQSAVYPIRYAVLTHLFLERSALCIRAIQDGEVAIFTAVLALQPFDVVTDYHRLLAVTVGRLQHQLLALLVLAVHLFPDLPFVLVYQAVGSLHDELCRAVVLFQLIQARALILFLEVQYIIDVSPSEAVDALCVVAHHAYPSVLLGQLQHDGLLSEVRVLILVHQHIAEPVDIFLADVLMVAQQYEGLHQQVVEVHRVRLSAPLRVPIIYMAHHRPLVLRVVSRPRAHGILLWLQQVVLRHRYAVGHRCRLIRLVIQLHLFDDALHQRPRIRLVVDGEVRSEAYALRLRTEYPRKHRVECTHLQPLSPLLPHQPSYTLLHLTSRLVRKGQRQNVPRSHIVVSQQIRYLIRQHARLSRSRTCYHQLRAVAIHDGLSLAIVQLTQQAVNIHFHDYLTTIFCPLLIYTPFLVGLPCN